MGFLDRFLGTPTPDDFAARLMRGMKAAGEPSELRYDPAEGQIVRLLEGKVVGVIHLGNMTETYLARPRRERADYLRTCIRSALAIHREIPAQFEDAQPDLRPRLWSRWGVEQARLQGMLGGPSGIDQVPFQPVGDHLLAGLAYDWPDSVQSVNRSDLERWGVAFDGAMGPARRNLDESTIAYSRIGDGFYSFISGDSYDASRLLLVERIASLDVQGAHVAMVPNRDELLVTGSGYEAGLAILAELAEKGQAEPYTLSGSSLILGEGGWSDWMPPEGHPLRGRFLDIRTRSIGPLYGQQKAMLDAVHERTGVGVFVASLSATKREDGGLTTYCVWGEGVETLLPEADRVAFMKASEGMAALEEWDRVRDLAGHLMERTEDYPPRYRVSEFPGDEILAVLGLGEM